MKKYILVTGGAGFVGSYLTKELIKENFHVVVVDDLSNGKIENITKEIEFYKLDIGDEADLLKIPLHPFQCVIHLAAQSSNAISFINPIHDLNTNQIGTYNIINFCIERKISRFIFTSSMSAYGKPQQLPTKESSPLNPDSFYAVHKVASEHYIRIVSKQNRIHSTIFRLYTTYGHGQNLDNVNQGLLSIYLSYILNNKPIIVKGSKFRRRDIIHVTDVVNAIILSLNCKKSYGKIYNLGTGETNTVEELIQLLTTGLGFEKKEYPVIYKSGTSGDPFTTFAAITKAKRDLGWRPKISAKAGIQMTIKPYLTDTITNFGKKK